MPQLRSHPTLGERRRFSPGPPFERTIVSAVVTELAPVLEPVARDPFIDGSDEVTRLRPAGFIPHSRRRPAARAL